MECTNNELKQIIEEIERFYEDVWDDYYEDVNEKKLQKEILEFTREIMDDLERYVKENNNGTNRYIEELKKKMEKNMSVYGAVCDYITSVVQNE